MAKVGKGPYLERKRSSPHAGIRGVNLLWIYPITRKQKATQNVKRIDRHITSIESCSI